MPSDKGIKVQLGVAKRSVFPRTSKVHHSPQPYVPLRASVVESIMRKISISDTLQTRLASLAHKTQQSVGFHIRGALEDYLYDREEVRKAERTLERIRTGREQTYSLQEVESRIRQKS